eukprot:254094_1
METEEHVCSAIDYMEFGVGFCVDSESGRSKCRIPIRIWLWILICAQTCNLISDFLVFKQTTSIQCCRDVNDFCGHGSGSGHDAPGDLYCEKRSFMCVNQERECTSNPGDHWYDIEPCAYPDGACFEDDAIYPDPDRFTPKYSIIVTLATVTFIAAMVKEGVKATIILANVCTDELCGAKWIYDSGYVLLLFLLKPNHFDAFQRDYHDVTANYAMFIFNLVLEDILSVITSLLSAIWFGAMWWNWLSLVFSGLIILFDFYLVRTKNSMPNNKICFTFFFV